MKYYRRIWIDEKKVSPGLYEKIVQMGPQYRQNDHVALESQPGDEVLGALIDEIHGFCNQHSLSVAGTGEFGTYIYEIVRHYEAHDLATVPFLILETQNKMFHERLSRDKAGRLMLPAKEAGTSIKFVSGMFNHFFVVSDSVRKTLESGQPTGLLFRETVLKGASSRVTTESLWEIDSNIKLPKMTNSVLNKHSVVPCYMIDERPYRSGEPHYLQGDLVSLGDFDIARTFEPLGSESGMVVSQRFYQHCLQHKISLRCRPVQIDS